MRGDGTHAASISGRFVPTHCAPPPSSPSSDCCGGILKADVVLFGEPLPTGALARAARKVLAAPVTVVCGTSLEVAPANTIPGLVKVRPFGRLVVVNKDRSGEDLADVFIQGRASDVMPSLVSRAKAIVARGTAPSTQPT